MKKLDIEKVMSLPMIKWSMSKDGKHCAWGCVAQTLNELVEATNLHFKFKYYTMSGVTEYSFLRLTCSNCSSKCMDPSCSRGIMYINDKESPERARRLLIRLLIEKGYVEPMDKDIELAKELLARPVSV